MSETIKALSLWQPWASLCVLPQITIPLPDEDHPFTAAFKEFETRSWKTSYRGVLLVHAAKRWQTDQAFYLTGNEYAEAALRGAGYQATRSTTTMPLGALIGAVELTACYRTEQFDGLPEGAAGAVSGHQRSVGDWSPGRYAWSFQRPQLFPEPVPYRGRQQLFDVPLTALPDEARQLVEVLR